MRKINRPIALILIQLFLWTTLPVSYSFATISRDHLRPSPVRANEGGLKVLAAELTGSSNVLTLPFPEAQTARDGGTTLRALLLKTASSRQLYGPPVNLTKPWIFISQAGGEAKRFLAPVPKTIYEFMGKPIARHGIDAAKRLGMPSVVIVGFKHEEVMRALGSDLTYTLQAERQGTGHATALALEALPGYKGNLIVVPGDAPRVNEELITTLQNIHAPSDGKVAAATILTTELEDPTGYGRIVRKQDGLVERIIEQKVIDRMIEVSGGTLVRDEGGQVIERVMPQEKDPQVLSKIEGATLTLSDGTIFTGEMLHGIKEWNSAMYAFQTEPFREALGDVTNDNPAGEFYLTDVIEKLARRGLEVRIAKPSNPNLAKGANTIEDLAEIETDIRREQAALPTQDDPSAGRIREKLEAKLKAYPVTQNFGNAQMGTDGIRGVATEEAIIAQKKMTPPMAYRLGVLAGLFALSEGKRVVALGRDTRESGPVLLRAVIEGASSLGVDVKILGRDGVAATPLVQEYVSRDRTVGGGVVVSASHNHYSENGVKLLAVNGEKISEIQEAMADRIMNTNNLPETVETLVQELKAQGKPIDLEMLAKGRGAILPVARASSDYVKRLTEPARTILTYAGYSSGQVPPGTPAIVDGANGAGGAILVSSLQELGYTVEAHNVGEGRINEQSGAEYVFTEFTKGEKRLPTGINPAIGEETEILTIDGDADRNLAFSKKYMVDGDKMLVFFAQALQKYLHTFQKVFGMPSDSFSVGIAQTVMANGASRKYLTEQAGIPSDRIALTKVGDKYARAAAQKLAERFGAAIYFEESGHGSILASSKLMQAVEASVPTNEEQTRAKAILLAILKLANPAGGDGVRNQVLYKVLRVLEQYDLKKVASLYEKYPIWDQNVTRLADTSSLTTEGALGLQVLEPASLRQVVEEEAARLGPEYRYVSRRSRTDLSLLRVRFEGPDQGNVRGAAERVAAVIGAEPLFKEAKDGGSRGFVKSARLKLAQLSARQYVRLNPLGEWVWKKDQRLDRDLTLQLPGSTVLKIGRGTYVEAGVKFKGDWTIGRQNFLGRGVELQGNPGTHHSVGSHNQIIEESKILNTNLGDLVVVKRSSVLKNSLAAGLVLPVEQKDGSVVPEAFPVVLTHVEMDGDVMLGGSDARNTLARGKGAFLMAHLGGGETSQTVLAGTQPTAANSKTQFLVPHFGYYGKILGLGFSAKKLVEGKANYFDLDDPEFYRAETAVLKHILFGIPLPQDEAGRDLYTVEVGRSNIGSGGSMSDYNPITDMKAGAIFLLGSAGVDVSQSPYLTVREHALLASGTFAKGGEIIPPKSLVVGDRTKVDLKSGISEGGAVLPGYYDAAEGILSDRAPEEVAFVVRYLELYRSLANTYVYGAMNAQGFERLGYLAAAQSIQSAMGSVQKRWLGAYFKTLEEKSIPKLRERLVKTTAGPKREKLEQQIAIQEGLLAQKELVLPRAQAIVEDVRGQISAATGRVTLSSVLQELAASEAAPQAIAKVTLSAEQTDQLKHDPRIQLPTEIGIPDDRFALLSKSASASDGGKRTPALPQIEKLYRQLRQKSLGDLERFSGTRLVVVGGGSGPESLAEGLSSYKNDTSYLSNVFDSGGSSGILREYLDIPAVGDIRNRIVSLLPRGTEEGRILRQLFDWRLPSEKQANGRSNHALQIELVGLVDQLDPDRRISPALRTYLQERLSSSVVNYRDVSLFEANVGNLILVSEYDANGRNLEAAAEALKKRLGIEGARVIPISETSAHLRATFEDGRIAYGEGNIVNYGKIYGGKMTDIGFVDRLGRKAVRPRPTPGAMKALKEAQAIVIGPGSAFTSYIPNLLVPGIAKTLRNSKSVKILVLNIQEQKGETEGAKASDVVKAVLRHLRQADPYYSPRNEDYLKYVLVNNSPSQKPYIPIDAEGLRKLGVEPVAGDLMNPTDPKRHDAQKLAGAVMSLLDIEQNGYEIRNGQLQAKVSAPVASDGGVRVKAGEPVILTQDANTQTSLHDGLRAVAEEAKKVPAAGRRLDFPTIRSRIPNGSI